MHRSPASSLRLLRLVGPSWSFFSPSEPHSKNDLEKTSKKVRKSRIWVSQNLAKTLPKTLPNRHSKKHSIFESIFDNIFHKSKPRNLENINFASTGARFLRISQKLSFYNFHAFWVQNPYQKPFQNQARTLEKSMLKTCCFSTSIF